MGFKRSTLTAGIAAALAGPVYADPPPIAGLPTVFCFRVTDMERPPEAYENNDPIDGTLLHDDRFRMAFEVLNWSDRSALGMQMFLNTATKDAGDKLTINKAHIDRDGRGGTTPKGPLSGAGNDPKYGEIDTNWDPKDPNKPAGGATHSDTIPHQGGRGNSGYLNDWTVYSESETSVIWDADAQQKTRVSQGGGSDSDAAETSADSSTKTITETFTVAGDKSHSLRNEDLLGPNNSGGSGRVPGTGFDALGDVAVDGGPGFGCSGDPCVFGPALDPKNGDFIPGAKYIPGPDDPNSLVLGVVPDPPFEGATVLGNGNVLDGFVLDIWGFEENDVLSLDWTLLGSNGNGGGGEGGEGGGTTTAVNCSELSPTDCFESIGVSGNDFGFGTFTIERGTLVGDANVVFNPKNIGLPGFGGDLTQRLDVFYADRSTGQSVADLPNITGFRGGFTGGSTVSALIAADDVFGISPSAALPEPATLGMLGAGMFALVGAGWRRRRTPRWS